MLQTRLRTVATGLIICGIGVTASALSPGCARESGVVSACSGSGPCEARLTLLHTSDIHSRLMPYDLYITQIDADLGLCPVDTICNVGGAARMKYVIDREMARTDRVLHLSGGDCFQGAPMFNYFSGEPEMRVQSELRIHAAALANHEFDRGAVNLARQVQKWANFPVLAANYTFYPTGAPNNTTVGSTINKFTVFNLDGVKVAVIGMGNLTSLTSALDQPNKLSILPLSTIETAQFYVDLLRPMVDLVVFTTHLGLDADQRMVRGTTGIDVVMGSHNHIVLNPPQQIRDCSVDIRNPGYVWAVDPRYAVSRPPSPPSDAEHPDPIDHPYMYKRTCVPRTVTIAHSGAFAKYVGRLDLALSNDPAQVSPTGDPKDYDPINKFEVLSNKYVAFPINASVPENARMADMLIPYGRVLDRLGDLDLLIGFSPNGARRMAPQGGDSALGNLVADSMWLRLGVQTDFAFTNSGGIRQDLLPGPVSVEELYNIFPFDNTITKMQLSGHELEQVFDFMARRASQRGCTAQVQMAGARARFNCTGCNRPGSAVACDRDSDCPQNHPGSCDAAKHQCIITACAEQIYIGHGSKECVSDLDCKAPDGPALPGSCDKPITASVGACLKPISRTNLYELATSNYIAQGGGGYRALQRNTTQFDTQIQQRDALIDYMRKGHPCGWRADTGTDDGLKACSTDSDCASEGPFVCACPGATLGDVRVTLAENITCESKPNACPESTGRCVRRDCRSQVASFHAHGCATSPFRIGCQTALNACDAAGEECRILACVDDKAGAVTDNRIQMIGR